MFGSDVARFGGIALIYYVVYVGINVKNGPFRVKLVGRHPSERWSIFGLSFLELCFRG